MMKNARVMLMKCEKTSQLAGIRMEERSDGWHITWAFPIKEKAASREGYNNSSVKGTFILDEEYNGCPYCGNTSFVKCGQCKKLTCYSGEGKSYCRWCGDVGVPSGTITQLDSGSNY